MRYLMVFFLVLLTASCSEKGKLLENTLELTIFPSSVSISTGGVVELTAKGTSAKSDNVEIDPVWSVANNLGTFSPERGTNVTFTAGATPGSGKIVATEDGVFKEIPLAITGSGGGTGGSSSVTFYDDSGLSSNFGIPDVFTWSASGLTASQVNDGNGPSQDPANYQSFSSDSSSWFGGGIVIDKVGGNPSPVDLTSYSSGNSLKFYIKLSRALFGSEDIKIEVEDSSGKATIYLSPTSSTYGFDGNSTNWQEIVIPLADFTKVDLTGIDFTSVKLPFEITAEHVSSSLTFYWDYVRWGQ